jgi:hypothetical protein
MTFDCSQLIGDECKRLKKVCLIGQRGCILQNQNFKKSENQNLKKSDDKNQFSNAGETKILK